MKFYIIALKVRMKQLLNRKVYLLVMLMLPLVVGVITIFGGQYIEKSGIKAGVYHDGDLAQEIASELYKNSNIEFIRYEDISQLEKAVAINDVECGIVMDKRLDKQREKGNFRKLITIIKSPATMADGPIQESVAGSFYKIIAEEMSYRYLINNNYVIDDGSLKEWINNKKDEYYDSGNLMEIIITTPQNMRSSTVEVNNTEESVIKVSRGFIAIFIMVGAILMGIQIIEEKDGAIIKRFKTIGDKTFDPIITIMIAHVILEFLLGLICILVIKISIGEVYHLCNEIIRLITYILSINIFVIFTSNLSYKADMWIAIMPMMIIATFVFCPIVIDASGFNVYMKYISRVLIPYYYLNGDGDCSVMIIISIVSFMGYKLSSKVKENI